MSILAKNLFDQHSYNLFTGIINFNNIILKFNKKFNVYFIFNFYF
jgi:hypothetical protein